MSAVPWVKLTDDWYEHPKFARVSPFAELLWLHCLAWSNRKLTDGFIPTVVVRQLAPDGREPRRLAAELLAAGLWEKADGGYAIHDYPDYQLTRAVVEARRKARSAAGRLGAAVRYGT